jgi:predicted dipeptidase
MITSVLLAATVAASTAAAPVLEHYDRVESKLLVPMTTEVVHFETIQGNTVPRDAQQRWIRDKAADFGFIGRRAGLVTEVELPGPEGAPVLGLVVHGDVQPVGDSQWSFPPFSGMVKDGIIYGRGVADDKGPLVQALLAMKALQASGIPRTHTIRLLVGSDEESDNLDIKEYLNGHKAPDYSLVLDSGFPVIVGEKAWNALYVTTPILTPGRADAVSKPWSVVSLDAGLTASIVPDHAQLVLQWGKGEPDWQPLVDRIRAVATPAGTRVDATEISDTNTLVIGAFGKSAHAGVNLEGGRNALIALAIALKGELPTGGANDLLTFVRLAGADLHGGGLGILDDDPLWGPYSVNVATIKETAEGGPLRLTINIRRTPPRTGPELKAAMQKLVADFNAASGAKLQFDGFWDDEPLFFDPNGKLVKRLLADYGRATGEASPKPAISGGGTYAKRLPNAIAFGMWFPDKPYPGHNVDEQASIADMHKGTRVLIETLVDLATGPKIEEPFKP